MPDTCATRELSWNGFPAVQIGNDYVRAVVVPTLGARIVSLVSRIQSGGEREWLWRNPYLEPQLPDFGAPYEQEFDLGGWHECFPSVARTRYPKGPWAGSEIPEHGELWCEPWKAKVSASTDEAEVRTVAYGVRFPYRFERSIYIRKDEPKMVLSYTANNLTIFPFPFLWSGQLCFDVRPGMSLAMPAQDMIVFSSKDGRFGHLGSIQTWPELISVNDEYFDVSIFPAKESGIAVKLYGAAPRSLLLREPNTNAGLQLQINNEQISHLALWLNFGGWCDMPKGGNYYNVTICPSIGTLDDLELAVHHFKEHGQLQPKNLRTWSFEIAFQ